MVMKYKTFDKWGFRVPFVLLFILMWWSEQAAMLVFIIGMGVYGLGYVYLFKRNMGNMKREFEEEDLIKKFDVRGW